MPRFQFQFHYCCTPGEGSPVNEELERRLVRPGGGYFESPDLLTQRLEEKPAGDSFTSRTGPLWRPSCFRASMVWTRGIADMTRIVIEIVKLFLLFVVWTASRPVLVMFVGVTSPTGFWRSRIRPPGRAVDGGRRRRGA